MLGGRVSGIFSARHVLKPTEKLVESEKKVKCTFCGVEIRARSVRINFKG
jgi:hypothetical protein